MERVQIGGHTLAFEPPDIIKADVRGDITPEDVHAISATIKRVSPGLPRLFVLADLARFRGISSEARSAAISQPSAAPYRGFALYNTSFHVRILMKFVLLALNLVTRRQDNPLAFFATEAEARRWIEERRRTIAREEPGG
jgi:hypothetical protein